MEIDDLHNLGYDGDGETIAIIDSGLYPHSYFTSTPHTQEKIRRKYRAEVLRMFGSYARGEQSVESDVDILVRFREDVTLFDLVGLRILRNKIGD
ncbi:MAG: nucleotidyltransferase domain-containing protein [Candidatus Thorarchaeota archaeon]|nr:nucleotidyltransferase domain-containing protein [Candidatus Thorarchaeota archaeon]